MTYDLLHLTLSRPVCIAGAAWRHELPVVQEYEPWGVAEGGAG